MTDKDKVKLIHRLCVNLSPLEYTDEKVGIGIAHALVVAVDLITDMKEQDDDST